MLRSKAEGDHVITDGFLTYVDDLRAEITAPLCPLLGLLHQRLVGL